MLIVKARGEVYKVLFKSRKKVWRQSGISLLTPGNDGLTKEFYNIFWTELKTPLVESINRAF